MLRSFANSRNKYLLLLKAEEFLRDRCISAALRRYDGPVFGMAICPAFPKNRHFDHVLAGDPHHPGSALDAVLAFERETGMRPEQVIPVTEMSLEPALEIAEYFGLPFLSRDCVQRARNKALMKTAFLEAGLATTRFRTFEDLPGLERAAEDLGFPIIVKPASAAHSIGVIRIDGKDALADAYAYCRDGLNAVKGAWRIDDLSLQAEQYFDADREVSVELVNHQTSSQVIAITEKYLTPPPYFAEIGHMVPSLDRDNAALKELAIRACRALGIDRGVSHVEVRVNRQGELSLIEVAARPGGDGIMDLVERSYGVNMYDLHVRSYLGRADELVEPPQLRGVSAIAFMQAPRGTVLEQRPPRSLPREVVSLYLQARQGDRVGGSLNYDDRLGTVEFFWPGEFENLGRRHLDAAAALASELYLIG